MPIDINLLRDDKWGDPKVVIDSETRRGRPIANVENVIALDREWRHALFEFEQKKKQFNELNKSIAARKKVNAADPCDDVKEESNKCKEDIAQLDVKKTKLETERLEGLELIGNIVHTSVPTSTNEDDNEIIRKWGIISSPKWDFDILHHHIIMSKLGGYESKKGVEVAGHRGYYLKGVLVQLNFALMSYAMDFLRLRNYELVQPPYFMKRDVMSATAELKDFHESLYRIPMAEGNDADQSLEQSSSNAENKKLDKSEKSLKQIQASSKEDYYLIATSEQPISALHKDDFIPESSLPIKYCGVSTCFRKEAGSHGKDTWGTFRVHQFEKVEQFILSTPEKSWELLESMITTSEEFYQSLDIPYRIVCIVSGAMNLAASKKYDLEAWFPGFNEYRELVSCSNCTDYQARSLACRLGHPKLGDREKRFVHMLNGTLVATQRAMCCILENYQRRDHVIVPRVLMPYMGGMEVMPYTQ